MYPSSQKAIKAKKTSTLTSSSSSTSHSPSESNAEVEAILALLEESPFSSSKLAMIIFTLTGASALSTSLTGKHRILSLIGQIAKTKENRSISDNGGGQKHLCQFRCFSTLYFFLRFHSSSLRVHILVSLSGSKAGVRQPLGTLCAFVSVKYNFYRANKYNLVSRQ